MERFFTTQEGARVDIVDHCKEQVANQENLKIYISCDSQVKRKTTTYATVVVFRYGTRGAHYVYRIDRLPKNKDVFRRLFKEGEFTLGLAQLITGEAPIKIEALEFDFNGVKKTQSTPVISAIRGWAESLGFLARFKGNEMIASKAADHVCREKVQRKKDGQ